MEEDVELKIVVMGSGKSVVASVKMSVAYMDRYMVHDS